jgi:hypothetical protein
MLLSCESPHNDDHLAFCSPGGAGRHATGTRRNASSLPSCILPAMPAHESHSPRRTAGTPGICCCLVGLSCSGLSRTWGASMAGAPGTSACRPPRTRCCGWQAATGSWTCGRGCCQQRQSPGTPASCPRSRRRTHTRPPSLTACSLTARCSARKTWFGFCVVCVCVHVLLLLLLLWLWLLCVWARACVYMCVRACVCVHACACVRVCVGCFGRSQ